LFIVGDGANYQRQFVFEHGTEEVVHHAGRIEFRGGRRGGKNARIVRSMSRVTKLFVASRAGVVGEAVRSV